MRTFMFPGQGSQWRGMGGSLFDDFKDFTRQADRILGYSIKELCLEDPNGELSKTQFTQPALYVVNALAYFKKIQETGGAPDYLVGHSLGEFNALLAAGCFDFEIGLELVRKRGELMSQAGDGAMAAILNATKEEIETILQDNGLTNIDLANYNAPSQIVISGARDEIGRAQTLFTGKMLYYPLNTSGAFHSRFMVGSRDDFQSYLKSFKFEDPGIPVISNVTARPYQNGEISDNLSKQISSTVRWCESIQFLTELGAHGGEEMQFEEIGTGDVLTKLVRTIKQLAPAPAEVRAPVDRPQSQTSSDWRSQLSEQIRDEGSSKRSGGEVPKKMTAEEKVNQWNKKHPVGTRLTASVMEYQDKDLQTKTEAVVLFGHRAAVYVKGYHGYFDLDEITPV
jgi:malonyl CoA-acyl carrier protein transacylase